MVLEERSGVLGNEPLLFREANCLAGLVGVLHSRFAVGSVCPGHGFDALADDGLADDQLRLTVLGGFGGLEGLSHIKNKARARRVGEQERRKRGGGGGVVSHFLLIALV